MKYRSLLKLFVFNVLTLGFYEYFWLSQTRQEMIAGYNVTIPHVKHLLLLYFINFAALFIVFLSLFHFIPQYNKQLDAITQPSPQCLIDYSRDPGQERLGQPATASQHCKQTVDTYYSEGDRINQAMTYTIGIMIACLVVTIVSPIFYARWFSQYSRAVAQVTNGKLSQNNTMLLFFLIPNSLSMVLVQNAFNQLGTDTNSRSPSTA